MADLPVEGDQPEVVREKARGIDDPDQRVLAMLAARDNTVAKTQATETEVKRSA